MRWRSLILVLGALTGALASGVSSPVEAAPAVSVTRLAGDTRYETAAAIAQAVFPAEGAPPAGQGTQNAVIASGAGYADALVGNYTAGQSNAPILLTQRDRLPEATSTTFERLGTDVVDIIGDRTVVSTTVAEAIAARGIEVHRTFGTDRYETSVAAARPYQGYEGVYNDGTLNGRIPAIVVSGQSYADALTAGAVAFGQRFPLLLSPHGALAPSVRQFLDESSSRITLVFVVGGTAAISNDVVAEIEALGIEVRRIAGTDRQGTAVAVAEFARTKLGWTFDRVVLARGDGYADAIAGGPLAGKAQAPILLTATPAILSQTTADYIRQHRATIRDITVLGGTAAISDTVAQKAQQTATGV